MMMCLNQQRIVIYQYRRDALEGEERIYELIRDMIIKMVQDLVAYYAAKARNYSEHKLQRLYKALSTYDWVDRK